MGLGHAKGFSDRAEFRYGMPMTRSSPRRGRTALLAASVLIASLLVAVPGASAHGTSSPTGRAISPTPVGGRAWTVPVIRLYDATPPVYREGIDVAIRSWNETRVGVRFARTSRRRLAHVVVGTARYPGDVAGKATLGMVRGAWVRLDTALVMTEHDQSGNTIWNLAGGAVPEEIAEVMSHELGHVLGLQHTRGCSLMSVSTFESCRYSPPSGSWPCRLPQRRDVLAMARRYGGVGVVRPNPYCRLSATPAGRVRAITVAGANRARAAVLSWRETTNTFGYVVARSAAAGACPATPDGGVQRSDIDFAEYTERWSELTPKAGVRYCYAVWSRNGRGTLTGPSRVIVDVRPPTIAPVTDLRATVAPASVEGESNVSFAWTSPPGTTAVRIYRSPVGSACEVPRLTPMVQVFGNVASGVDDHVPSGTHVYVAVRSEDPGDDESTDGPWDWPSPPACVTVTTP